MLGFFYLRYLVKFLLINSLWLKYLVKILRYLILFCWEINIFNLCSFWYYYKICEYIEFWVGYMYLR